MTLIGGPTASGKSALAMDLARRTGAVVVNADSQQLYAGLRLLTARPTEAEEAEVPHRLYGVADPAEAWSVGRWLRAVAQVLAQLAADGRPAVVVGGTGLYFHALTRGLADTPDISRPLRDETQARFDAAGETAFRADLAEVDPRAAARIAPGDRQRLVRAMAVAVGTGRALSDWWASSTPLLRPGTYERLLVQPDRASLYAACDARVLRMLDHGLLGEAEAFLARGLAVDLPSMKAVGLREIALHLQGETDLASAVSAMQQATRRYAKRQLTWFRNQAAEWPSHSQT